MLYLASPRLIPIVGFLVLPLVVSIYWQKVILSVAVFSLLAISWDILAQSGMVSLGQALFFGMGAYCAGIMNHYFGWHPFLTIPLATIFGGGFLYPGPPARLAPAGNLLRHGHTHHTAHAGADHRGFQDIRGNGRVKWFDPSSRRVIRIVSRSGGRIAGPFRIQTFDGLGLRSRFKRDQR